MKEKGSIRYYGKPVIRYDTAHGFAHIDRIYPDGQIEKQPLYFDNYNLAFTYAI